MNQPTVPGPTVSRHPIEDLEGYVELANLALDVGLTWKHGNDAIWRQIDPDLWEATRNPWVILHTASRRRLQELLSQADFKKSVDDNSRQSRRAAERPNWFAQAHPQSELTCVAYFSMEYMLSEALPLYSGGLGNVAGDQLKAADDLGVPIVAIGLLYQQGYFRQVIDSDGVQQELYPYNDPGQLPITPSRTADGEWIRLEVKSPGYSTWLRVWQVRVGSVMLYLLDTNDPANNPTHRGITSELYGGGPELRLLQELVLGIGGWRLLVALGLEPEVCHLNEGHAAFAVLERARSFAQKTGRPFDAALAATRSGNIFTTHTAAPAGFDRFSPTLMERYLADYARRLGISFEDFMALGRRDPNDASEPFNMAYLAIRGSGAVNGVSRLHGQVSRELFAPLFPRWPVSEVPVGYVTNGIHVPTWASTAARELWIDAYGRDCWRGLPERAEPDLSRVDNQRLWEMRTARRKSFIGRVRQRLARQLAASGSPAEEIEAAQNAFDPEILTMGFARRFASYKRPNLLLRDPERLIRLLTHSDRPIQLVLAGKAHPADEIGQGLIQQWIRFVRRPEVRDRVVFLSDYDMLLTRQMVAGVDVWLNTPRRPWEASGTSGMKGLANGMINLSELDGWWAEAYTPDVGWALGDGRQHADEEALDTAEAEALYRLLEQQVIPEFYRRDESGTPVDWLARMRRSMARLTPQYCADRTVREYTERYYLPAAAAYRERAADRGKLGNEIADWRRATERKWAGIHFGQVTAVTSNDRHEFRMEVFLGGVGSGDVGIEIYAEGPGGCSERLSADRGSVIPGGFVYTASAPAGRPISDYTARIVPRNEKIAIPLECGSILWQR